MFIVSVKAETFLCVYMESNHGPLSYQDSVLPLNYTRKFHYYTYFPQLFNPLKAAISRGILFLKNCLSEASFRKKQCTPASLLLLFSLAYFPTLERIDNLVELAEHHPFDV